MMKRVFKQSFVAVFIVLVVLLSSCKKKEVNKIVVNNQFAIALFHDTISIKDVLHDMDSHTESWLSVKPDGSLYAYYSDSIKGAVKASDFLGDIEDVHFSTNTPFSMPLIESLVETDTTLFVEKFTEIPFDYEGFDIEEVVLRHGLFYLDIMITPDFPMLKQIEIFSEQLVSEDDEPLRIVIDYGKGRQSVDLSDYKILPDANKSVVFSSNITFHYDPIIGFDGGDYNCLLDGGLDNIGFKTVYAIVTQAIDTMYVDQTAVDFGVNGLSGSAFLPVPSINLTYKNTFGLGATSDVSKLNLVNAKTGLVTDLLATDHWVETIEPTNGEYRSKPIGNFVDEIDALAGYTRLDFDVRMSMAMPGEHISISDTSTIDVVADIEMPMSFSINDLRYADTIKLDLGYDSNPQNYLDEIDFFIDYDNKIPIQVGLQCLFLKNGHVIDSLFDNGATLLYNEPSNIECFITDHKINNIMRANQMILRLDATTNFQTDPVILRESDNIALRMRMLTKTYEIDIDDVL